MRRLVVLGLLLAACGSSGHPAAIVGPPGSVHGCWLTGRSTAPVAPSPGVECLPVTVSPAASPDPTVAPSPPPSPDTLASASDVLSATGGEVTLVKGLSPDQALRLMLPGQVPRPTEELCDGSGAPRVEPTTSSHYAVCLIARTVGAWTLVYGDNDLTVADGGDALLQRLSADGREVVFIADHFEADAPFRVARDGHVVRTFDFCSEGSADDGAPLPEEAGLDLKGCTAERFELVRRLTGVTVTADLLTGADGIAVVRTY